MKNLKISILGAEGFTCQVPRIKEGMEMLGHVVSKESPDIIYSNDPRGYNEALFLKKKKSKCFSYIKFFRFTLAPTKHKKTNRIIGRKLSFKS